MVIAIISSHLIILNTFHFHNTIYNEIDNFQRSINEEKVRVSEKSLASINKHNNVIKKNIHIDSILCHQLRLDFNFENIRFEL